MVCASTERRHRQQLRHKHRARAVAVTQTANAAVLEHDGILHARCSYRYTDGKEWSQGWSSGVKSPLRWPGGKGRLAETIISAMPAHEAYVEGCCGGAAVFWAKPKDVSRAEILNDADGELINFYHVLHKFGRRLAQEVDAMPYSRALFRKIRSEESRSAFRRAVRFWYLNRVAFGAKRRATSFGVKASTRTYVLPSVILEGLDRIMERLHGVCFEAIDVERLITLYDRARTLFYIDPPFYGTSQPYAVRFYQTDHERLCCRLKKIQGTFLLSYNDCREVRRLYRGLHWRRLLTRYTLGCNSSGGGTDRGEELLISNRPFGRLRKAK